MVDMKGWYLVKLVECTKEQQWCVFCGQMVWKLGKFTAE